jgi:hypothetical protein
MEFRSALTISKFNIVDAAACMIAHFFENAFVSRVNRFSRSERSVMNAMALSRARLPNR